MGVDNPSGAGSGGSWGGTLSIDSDCDSHRISSVFDQIRRDVEGASARQPLIVELTDETPTALALQLLAAARKSLDRAGAFAGYGPKARAAISFEDRSVT